MTHELAKRRLGQQVGNYRLINWLGQGGFADVYLGEHLYLKTQSAIKMLHVQLSEQMHQSFLREAQVIAALDHPNIVRVLDYGLEQGNPYLVMSYASNGSIRHLAPRKTPLPPEHILTIVQQIASALDYAHQHKLIHRDIKPENMLIGQHGQVLLSDFGLVIVAQSSDSQSAHMMAGTIPYTAPEQLQGQVRFASDQYSLGVVTYEWICGERPFSGTFAEIASQHLLTPPPSLCQKVPGLSSEVEQVIFKALAKDPDQRFETVTAFANALQAAYQQTPLLALPIQASTEHPASAEPITTPLADSSYSSATPATPVDVLPSEQLNVPTLDAPIDVPPSEQLNVPALDAPVHQLLASSAPPSLQPLPQATGGSRRRKLVAPLILLLALLIGGGAWYSAFLFSGHKSDQRQISTLNAGQVTLTATPQGQPQATPSAIATGIVQGSTSVPTTGAPSTPVPTTATPNTTAPTPTASTPPAPTATAGQTPTPVPDCLSGSQSNLSFTSLLGLGNPGSQVVTLTNCGGSTSDWTATAVPNSGGSWLKANPSAGTLAVNSGQNVQVQAVSTGLKVGIYKGTITFRKGSATWVVTVTYTIVQA